MPGYGPESAVNAIRKKEKVMKQITTTAILSIELHLRYFLILHT